MSDSEDDFAPSKPANNDSDDDFAPSKPEPEPKPKLKGEEKKAQETKEFDEICEQGMAHVEEEEWKDATLCFERLCVVKRWGSQRPRVSYTRGCCGKRIPRTLRRMSTGGTR